MITEITVEEMMKSHANYGKNTTKINSARNFYSGGLGMETKNIRDTYKVVEAETKVKYTNDPVVMLNQTNQKLSTRESEENLNTDSQKTSVLQPDYEIPGMYDLNRKGEVLLFNDKEDVRIRQKNEDWYTNGVTQAKGGRLSSYILRKETPGSKPSSSVTNDNFRESNGKFYTRPTKYKVLSLAENYAKDVYAEKKVNSNRNGGTTLPSGFATGNITGTGTPSAKKYEIQNPFKKNTNIQNKGGKVDFVGRNTKMPNKNVFFINPQTNKVILSQYQSKKNQITLIQSWWKKILQNKNKKNQNVIKIQSFWRGHNLRLYLYILLTRYYKGRAFISHINKIKKKLRRDVFKDVIQMTFGQKYNNSIGRIIFLQKLIKKHLTKKNGKNVGLMKVLLKLMRKNKEKAFNLMKRNTLGDELDIKRRNQNAERLVNLVDKKMKLRLLKDFDKKIYQYRNTVQFEKMRNCVLGMLFRKYINKINVECLDKNLNLWKAKAICLKLKSEEEKKIQNMEKLRKQNIYRLTYKLMKKKMLDEENVKNECFRKWKIFYMDLTMKMLKKKMEVMSEQPQQPQHPQPLNEEVVKEPANGDGIPSGKKTVVKKVVKKLIKKEANVNNNENNKENSALEQEKVNKTIQEELEKYKNSFYEKIKANLENLEKLKLLAHNDHLPIYNIIYNIDSQTLIDEEIQKLEEKLKNDLLYKINRNSVFDNVDNFSINSIIKAPQEMTSEVENQEDPNKKGKRIVKVIKKVKRLKEPEKEENDVNEYIIGQIRKTTAVMIVLIKQNLKNKNIYQRMYWKRWNEVKQVEKDKEQAEKSTRKKVNPRAISNQNLNINDSEEEMEAQANGVNQNKKIVTKTVQPKIVKTNQTILVDKVAGAKLIRRCSNNISKKTLWAFFYQWQKTVMKIKNKKEMAQRNLNKILTLLHKKKEKGTAGLFRSWFTISKIQSERDNKKNLKVALYAKVAEKFLYRGIVGVLQKRFTKWKMMSSNLKQNLMFTIGLTRFSKIARKINNRRVIAILLSNAHKRKVQEVKEDKLNILCRKVVKSERSILKFKFNRWRGPNRAYQKVNVIEQLNTLYKTTGRLKQIMDKIIARRFFVNMKRKADWENPKKQIKKVRFTKYFLKNGTTVSVSRHKPNTNYLWKFGKPLRYFFGKFRTQAIKLKSKELEGLSNKWQIEERNVNPEEEHNMK